MSKKIKINEQQLELIVNYIKENENPIIIKEDELIEEGWKEIFLGAALLLGANLTSAQTEKADQLLQNANILKQVEATLESNTEIEKLANYFKMDKSNLETYMQKNADKIEARFDKYADEGEDLKLKTVTSKDSKSIEDKLKQGYAIKDIKITKDTILPKDSIVLVQDTMNLEYGSDAMFITGGYELTPQTIKELSENVKDIQNMGGNIVKVYIESSTDTEPIKMGNEKLAQLRANSVKQLLVDSGVVGDIEIITKADSGPDLYSKTMSKEERKEARQETSKYRYTKVKIISIIPVAPDNETTQEVVDRVEVELVKASISSGTQTKTKKSTGGKRTKCKSIKFKGSTTACPVF